MFKPVHGLNGTLAASISAAANTMQLDSQSLCLLQKRLNNGEHHTYLVIRAGYDYEIVRTGAIVGLNISIDRGQDDTTPRGFAQGSNVEFVLSETAMSEIITQRALGNINLQGGGIVSVTQNGPNSYTISAPEIELTSASDKILVGGEFPNFVLSVAPNLNCCD